MIPKIIKFNWEVVGHKNILRFLEKTILSKKIDHAYLFYGSKSLGKRRVAEAFINILLCFSQKTDHLKSSYPCQVCLTCDQVAKRIHSDVHWIEKDENKKNITIEQIRALQHKLSVSSFYNSYKIGLIDNAEKMTEEAANSLLKILEEPKEKVIFILISQEVNLLPATIVSRCRQIKFLPVNKEEIFQFLDSGGASREDSLKWSRLSNGRPGVAIEFQKSPKKWDEYQEQVFAFLKVIKSNLRRRLEIVASLNSPFQSFTSKVEIFESYLSTWNSLLRDLLFLYYNKTEFVENINFKDDLTALREYLPLPKVVQQLNNLKQISILFKKNVNPRLVWENFIINI